MPRVITIKSARKDYPDDGIQKGDTYYKWKFNFGPLYRSKTYPKPSQLTRSEYLGTLYSIQERIPEFSEMTEASDVESLAEELKDELQCLCDETQEKHDNMPEQLQDSDSGMLLQERVDNLENVINEFDSLDFDVDDDLKGEDKQDRISEIVSDIEGIDIDQAAC